MRNSFDRPDWWNHGDSHDVATDGGRKQIPPELNDTCHRIIGAAIEVHRELGPGFVEVAYEQALAMELAARQVPFERQVSLPVIYKGHEVAQQRLDLLVQNAVIVEIKAVESLSAVHVVQVLSYLKAGAFHVGLLINFNVSTLKSGIRRLVWNI